MVSRISRLAIAFVLLVALFVGCDKAVKPIWQPPSTRIPPTSSPTTAAQNSPTSADTIAETQPDPATADTSTDPAAETQPDPHNYRYWIEQARLQYHYDESADAMWQVMQCESGGDANAVNPNGYFGLFQYSPDTWAGDWNPYNGDSIFDSHAQIFATAKAWQDGNQSWWDCYGR